MSENHIPHGSTSDEGHVVMHNGSSLFWKRNEAGGRTYYSDEIGGGVMVWDTALVDLGTLCEAISMELALQRAQSREARRADSIRFAAMVKSLQDSQSPDGLGGPDMFGTIP